MVLTKEDFQFIKENDSQYKSQVGQDIIVDHILNKKIKGFFVDSCPQETKPVEESMSA